MIAWHVYKLAPYVIRCPDQPSCGLKGHFMTLAHLIVKVLALDVSFTILLRSPNVELASSSSLILVQICPVCPF